MANNNNKTDDGVIGAFYGNKKFVKIKPAWGIGKVILSFVQTDDHDKAIASGDYYLDVSKAGCLAKAILSGELQSRAEQMIAADQKRAMYTPLFADQGGKPEKSAGRADGKALARVFTILPASAKGCPVCFHFEMGAGTSNAQGLIVPDWWSGNTAAKEWELTVPINNVGTARPMYLHNGPLDQFGVTLNGAIQAYYVKGMLDGSLFTVAPRSNEGGEKGDKKGEANAQQQTKPAGSGSAPAAAANTVTVVFHEPFAVSGNNANIYYTKATGGPLVSQIVWVNKSKMPAGRFEEICKASASKEPIAITYTPVTGNDGKNYLFVS